MNNLVDGIIVPRPVVLPWLLIN